MRGRKILVVCGGFKLYGAENATLTLMRALRQGGAEVACFTSDWSDGGFKAALEAEGFPYRSAKVGWVYLSRPWWTLATLINLPRAMWVFWRWLRTFRPDVVLHAGYRTLVLHFLLTGRDNFLCVHDQLSRDRQAVKFLPLLDSQVIAYLACSNFVGEDLKKLRVTHSKVRVLRNCTEIPSSPRVKAFDGTLRLGIVGQINPNKGHPVLIQALGQLRREGWPFHLDIFGTGEDDYLEQLRRFCTEADILDRVTFRGFEVDRGIIYGGIDVAVVPTIALEAFGLAALEPAAFGLPVIASELGGLPEIIESGRTGLLFRPGEADQLADCIREFLQEPRRMVRMGAAARQRAEACFSVPVMLRRMQELGLVGEAATPD